VRVLLLAAALLGAAAQDLSPVALAKGDQSPYIFVTAAIAASSSMSPTTITVIAGGSNCFW
jgi:hypothetical protein